MFCLLGLGISAAYCKDNVPTPFFEWAVGIYYIMFFAIVSFDNPFYDSIHEEGDLVRKQL
jgi:hypothetical protein